ncbi:MAG: anti-sigma factor antagonist [Marmoricola sp.]|nr:anti-sigma factor antagonist [Marmoricola sp.]
MTDLAPLRPRADLLRELCSFLPAEEARQVRAMDPDDDHVLVAAFTAVKRLQIVLPEALHGEVAAVFTTLLGSRDASSPTSIEVRVRGEVVVVELHGELDIHLIEDLRTTFLHVITPVSNQVVIDLGQTTFMDSIILGSLVAAQRRAAESGGWLRLAAPRPNVRHILQLTQLDQVFEVLDSTEEALAP